MAENIKFEVVTPEKLVVNENAQMVVAPGALGEFGILSGHTPFLSTLKTGIIRYTDEKGKDKYVFVSGGFAEALPDKVTVLVESAEKMEDIDPERAKEAMKRAEERLAADRAKEKVDIARAKAAIERAVIRIKIAGI